MQTHKKKLYNNVESQTRHCLIITCQFLF